MKKQLYGIAVAITLPLLTTGNAQADFVAGVRAGTSSVYGEIDARPTLDGTLGENETGSSFGAFGQYRHTLGNNVVLGVHLGYENDSTEWDVGVYEDAQNFVTGKVEIGRVIDLLGVVTSEGNRKVNPIAMFGLSRMTLEASGNGKLANVDTPYKADDTLTGWKLALGAEFPVGESWLGHVLLHHVDYGDGSFKNQYGNYDIEGNHTGLRLGIGYRF